MIKIVASDVCKENYRKVVNEYIEQLEQEKDITLFGGVFGYYMYKGLVHEIRLDNNQVVDETYASWSVKEKNFVLNVLDHRMW